MHGLLDRCETPQAAEAGLRQLLQRVGVRYEALAPAELPAALAGLARAYRWNERDLRNQGVDHVVLLFTAAGEPHHRAALEGWLEEALVVRPDAPLRLHLPCPNPPAWLAWWAVETPAVRLEIALRGWRAQHASLPPRSRSSLLAQRDALGAWLASEGFTFLPAGDARPLILWGDEALSAAYASQLPERLRAPHQRHASLGAEPMAAADGEPAALLHAWYMDATSQAVALVIGAAIVERWPEVEVLERRAARARFLALGRPDALLRPLSFVEELAMVGEASPGSIYLRVVEERWVATSP